MIITNIRPVLIQVVYYLPDYPSLLQEFVWGFDDKIPELYKTHKFINHWRQHIDAVISEVLISINDSSKRTWRPIDEILSLN